LISELQTPEAQQAKSREARMSSHADPAPHPWRRYLRFSVRGLIVVVLVIGGGLGWVIREAHIQRDAVAAIEKAGGWVRYDWEWRNGNSIPGGQPWAPGRLVDLIGVDYFGHVVAVWFWPSLGTDGTLVHVGRLTRLQMLFVSSPSVRGVGLAHLKGLANLSGLDLSGSEVSDVGLAHLKGLTSLSHLDLSETRVTDAGLTHLKGLTKLSYLGLRGTQVTRAGMNALERALPGLTIDHL
jgi:hypothetical protein